METGPRCPGSGSPARSNAQNPVFDRMLYVARYLRADAIYSGAKRMKRLHLDPGHPRDTLEFDRSADRARGRDSGRHAAVLSVCRLLFLFPGGRLGLEEPADVAHLRLQVGLILANDIDADTCRGGLILNPRQAVFHPGHGLVET